MAADIPVNRANIDAGCTADALQHLLEFRPENIGTPVVDDHEVEFFLLVDFSCFFQPVTVVI